MASESVPPSESSISQQRPTPPSFTPFIDSLLLPHTSTLSNLHASIGNPASSAEVDLAQARAEIEALVQEVFEKAAALARGAVDKREEDKRVLGGEVAALKEEIVELKEALGDVGSAGAGEEVVDDEEQPLLIRRDGLVKARDKLKHVYDERLARSNMLVARLTTLHATLGPEHVILPPASSNRYSDVALFSIRTMEENIRKAEDELSRRKELLLTAVSELVNAFAEIQSPVPSRSASDAPDPVGDILLAALPNLIAAREEEVERAVLGIAELLEPTSAVLSRVEALLDEVLAEKTWREDEIQAIYDELTPLWERLEVSEEEMDAFIMEWMGSTLASVEAYRAELARMQELKRENMAFFVERLRTDIEALWDEMYVGEAERSEFQWFFDESFTEECLAEHEAKLVLLQEERASKERMLEKLGTYFEVLKEEEELTAAMADTSRLTGRGPRDPGRLIREEKMRKRVAKKPQHEKDLRFLLAKWENENGRPFMVNDERYADVMAERAEQEAMAKENKKRSRTPAPSSAPPPARSASSVARAGLSSSTTSRSTSMSTRRRPAPGSSTTTTPTPSLKKPRLAPRSPAPSSRIPGPTPKRAGAAPALYGGVPRLPSHATSLYSVAESDGGQDVFGALPPPAAGAGRRKRRESFRPSNASSRVSGAPSSLFERRTASSASSWAVESVAESAQECGP